MRRKKNDRLAIKLPSGVALDAAVNSAITKRKSQVRALQEAIGASQKLSDEDYAIRINIRD